MSKDIRYKTVKILIEGGHIASFAEIFNHIPKTVVSLDFGTNYKRFVNLVNDPTDFKLRELITLAGLFEISEKEMIDLAYNQYLNKKAKRKKP